MESRNINGPEDDCDSNFDESLEYQVYESDYKYTEPAQSKPFLFQHLDFESLVGGLPSFVRANYKKNGRFTQDTFILRINYLRRRKMMATIDGNNAIRMEDGKPRITNSTTLPSPSS
ncbi:hypothetical protein SNE40_010382 [Patella caerulea]|uniref:Uncharacterized protein n=1 Tax=Patella caerulea TaxID=87958 RepID=A0AAN8PRJ6_PATCE